MSNLSDWTLVQNPNQVPDAQNQLELSQSAEPVRIQKVVYPNLSESSNYYVEMTSEANNIQAPLNNSSEQLNEVFEIQTIKYLSYQCLAIGFGSFLGIFRCFGFIFVELIEQRRYERYPEDFNDFCRRNYYYSYQNSDCFHHLASYSDYMAQIIRSDEEYRWTFYVLVALIIGQSVAIVLFRKTQIMKRFQRLNYIIQSSFLSCLVLSIVSHNNWMQLYVYIIPLSIFLFLICQAQIINLTKYHYQLKYDILNFFVYGAFVINTILVFRYYWIERDIIISELVTIYLVYYLVQLEQSLNQNKVKSNEVPQQVNITEIVQQICSSDSESIEQAQVEEVSKQYCVLKKKYVYLAGAASLLVLFVLSLMHFMTFLIALAVISNTILETQVVSSTARFGKDDYFIASSLVFIDFACPLKNIYRSIKNSRSQ